ncbi:MAG TPA: hypothetical protein VEL76_14295 [Gemmataceae bacterium]|nr:hypothetical protein [Gemmataceae bacterium]
MIKDLQVTLYDIFGFLIPGTVFLAAVGLLFGAVYLPQSQAPLVTLDAAGWVVLVLVAYLAGHMAQSLGNLLEKLYKATETVVLEGQGPYRLPDVIIVACRTKVQETLDVAASGLDPRWLYRVCDDAVIRSGKIGERDVYIYREGFYRGAAVSFALLTFAVVTLLVRLYLAGQHTILAGWATEREHLWFLFTLSLGCSYLAFRRYRRFGMYRVTHAMIGFLTVKDEKKSDSSKKDA